MKNTISVLMSLYEKESPSFLVMCLNSLKVQSRPADEIIIVVDGNIGFELTFILNEYKNTLPIEIVYLPNSLGLGAALNEGLKCCKGNLIARMDTDDICMKDRLEKQENYFDSYDVDILGSAAFVIDFSGEHIGERVNPSTHNAIVDSLWCNPFIHPSVMFKKASIDSIGSYNPELRRRQDYELWFRAAKNGLKLANLEDKLIKYRFGRHTLKKQSPSLALKQAFIGFNGCLSCNLGMIKAIICFIPFLRSLMPVNLQMKFTRLLHCFYFRARGK
ncbi:glycosyltransferase [Vibrio cholerae]|nr:glycosyltransferase [Vibrio cholerae]